MFVLLYFVPPFLAYRMGARGGWLWAIILLSWPAFAVWLVVRAPDKDRLRRREDAELARTLMIVRAINPQMADKIEIEQAIARTLAAAPKRRPARKPPPKHQAIVVTLAVVLAVTALAMAPPPIASSNSAVNAPARTYSREGYDAHQAAKADNCAGLLLALQDASGAQASMWGDWRETERLKALGLCGRSE